MVDEKKSVKLINLYDHISLKFNLDKYISEVS